jgi:hypothetical protein
MTHNQASQVETCATQPEFRLSGSDKVVRERAGYLLLDRPELQIRLAGKETQTHSSSLVARRYRSRGYKHTSTDGCATAASMTLQACRGADVLGTLTFFNCGAELAADALYRAEIDPYREEGVCEIGRLAVDPEFGSKPLLGALFHCAHFLAGDVHAARHIFIEVNPRHAPFYRRMLGFRQVGPVRVCPRVDAPAVLLHIGVEYGLTRILELGGTAGANPASRSLYPYFCGADERALLARHISALQAATGIRANQTKPAGARNSISPWPQWRGSLPLRVQG